MKLSYSDQHDGLDLNWRRNRWQATAALLTAAAGAASFAWMAPQDRAMVGALGGLLGLAIGTFLSGLVIMWSPTPEVSVETVQANLDRLRQRFRKLIVAWIALLVTAIASYFSMKLRSIRSKTSVERLAR